MTLAAERRLEIQHKLEQNGLVTVAEISRSLGVSEATVRRDFARMEHEGLLERTRGGSILTRRVSSEPLFTEKDALNLEAKRRIAEVAASLPGQDDSIFVNSGSTNRQVIQSLFRRGVRRIVTTNAAAPHEHAGNTELLVTGGIFRAASNSFVGPLAHSVISRMYARFTFIGIDGLSITSGLTTPSLDESEISRLMMERTVGTVVAVADHSKIGAVADFVCSPVSAIDILVTDRELDIQVRRQLSQLNIDVHVASDD